MCRFALRHPISGFVPGRYSATVRMFHEFAVGVAGLLVTTTCNSSRTAKAFLNNANHPVSKDEPPGVPTNVQHEVLSSDTISVWWQPPRGSDKTIVRGYTVGWGTSDHVDAMAISLEGEESTSVKLDGLKPDTEYVVTLSAFNDMGDGIQHREVIRTKPDPTDLVMSPTKVQAVVLSPTEILLIWEETACDVCHEFGTPVYIIKYGPREMAGRDVQVFVGSERQFLIANLLPDTEYEFAVKTKNRYGDSAWSSPAFAKTFSANKEEPTESYGTTSSETEELDLGRTLNKVEDQAFIQNTHKNEAPKILRLFASSPNSLHIQWKRPARSRRTITGYQIFYKLWTDDVATTHDWMEKSILGDLESYDLEITEKKSGQATSKVDVKIRAITSLGPSSFSEIASCDFDTTPKGFLPNLFFVPAVETLNTKADGQVARIKADKEITSLDAGDTFSISCVVTQGGHTLIERWYFPNGSLVPFDTGSERAYVLFLKNNTVLRLVVDFLRPEDSGYYTCGRKVSGHVLGESIFLHVHPERSQPDMHETTAVQPPEDLPPILCKFEASESRWCNWKPDVHSEISWNLVSATTYGRLLQLPPGSIAVKEFEMLNRVTFEVTASPSSHYFLWHNIGSAKPKAGSLSSPVFPTAFSFGYCFSFSFAVGPRSRGRMNIYMQPYPANGEKKNVLLALNLRRGSTQAEAWQSCTVQLLQVKHDFKIIVQVISSADEQLAVALDSVQLIPGACGSVCNGLASSTTIYSTSPSAPPTIRERSSNHGTKQVPREQMDVDNPIFSAVTTRVPLQSKKEFGDPKVKVSIEPTLSPS
ncbi:fn3 and MAM domain containing protein [Trichuris trichiura]|uniref:Fn3 and MAM domain containing protein n=1 Tax=Trichuris trichiura TaxID=36087 RepID=A0A077Z4M6_TRITR|nr:fn3 and MAM domain containing protein [Trichuris trichiura]